MVIALNLIQLFSVFRKHLVIGQFSLAQFFFLLFIKSLLIGKPRMTPVSFVKTTESYDVSLVTISRQTSYYSGFLRLDYRIIRGLPMVYTRFADWVTISVLNYRNRPKRAGLITASERIVQAVHSCITWFLNKFLLNAVPSRGVKKKMTELLP